MRANETTGNGCRKSARLKVKKALNQQKAKKNILKIRSGNKKIKSSSGKNKTSQSIEKTKEKEKDRTVARRKKIFEKPKIKIEIDDTNKSSDEFTSEKTDNKDSTVKRKFDEVEEGQTNNPTNRLRNDQKKIKVLKYACDMCDKKFTTIKRRVAHRVTHEGVENFPCPLCKKKCSSSTGLERHFKVHGDNRFFCHFCSFITEDKEDFEKHQENHPSFTSLINGRKRFWCHICRGDYPSLKNLRLHQAKHDPANVLECQICCKKFKSTETLKYHMKTIHDETQEKKFVCSVCSKPFWSNSELKKHERVHTNERPYLCHECSAAFKTVGNLITHQKCVHNKAKWECQICGEIFTNKKTYTRHCVQLHEGVGVEKKPFEGPGHSCQECGKFFNRKADLKVHYRIHTGDKPYKCTDCGRDFRCNTHLKQHLVIHSGEKPHKCLFCKKGFSQYANVNVHMKKCKLRCFRILTDKDEKIPIVKTEPVDIKQAAKEKRKKVEVKKIVKNISQPTSIKQTKTTKVQVFDSLESIHIAKPMTGLVYSGNPVVTPKVITKKHIGEVGVMETLHKLPDENVVEIEVNIGTGENVDDCLKLKDRQIKNLGVNYENEETKHGLEENVTQADSKVNQDLKNENKPLKVATKSIGTNVSMDEQGDFEKVGMEMDQISVSPKLAITPNKNKSSAHKDESLITFQLKEKVGTSNTDLQTGHQNIVIERVPDFQLPNSDKVIQVGTSNTALQTGHQNIVIERVADVKLSNRTLVPLNTVAGQKSLISQKFLPPLLKKQNETSGSKPITSSNVKMSSYPNCEKVEKQRGEIQVHTSVPQQHVNSTENIIYVELDAIPFEHQRTDEERNLSPPIVNTMSVFQMQENNIPGKNVQLQGNENKSNSQDKGTNSLTQKNFSQVRTILLGKESGGVSDNTNIALAKEKQNLDMIESNVIYQNAMLPVHSSVDIRNSDQLTISSADQDIANASDVIETTDHISYCEDAITVVVSEIGDQVQIPVSIMSGSELLFDDKSMMVACSSDGDVDISENIIVIESSNEGLCIATNDSLQF